MISLRPCATQRVTEKTSKTEKKIFNLLKTTPLKRRALQERALISLIGTVRDLNNGWGMSIFKSARATVLNEAWAYSWNF